MEGAGGLIGCWRRREARSVQLRVQHEEEVRARRVLQVPTDQALCLQLHLAPGLLSCWLMPAAATAPLLLVLPPRRC